MCCNCHVHLLGLVGWRSPSPKGVQTFQRFNVPYERTLGSWTQSILEKIRFDTGSGKPCIPRCNHNSRIRSPSSGGCSCRGKPYKPVCAGAINPHLYMTRAKTFANSCEARCQGFLSWRNGRCPSGHNGNTHSVNHGNTHSSPGDSLLTLFPYSLQFYRFTKGALIDD